MYRTTLALAAIFAVAIAGNAAAADVGGSGADLPVKAAPKKVVETPYFLVNENSVSYHYEFTATNPGAGKTPKNVGTFSHFDVWAYGTNFVNIDWLKATSTDTPSLGVFASSGNCLGGVGARNTCAGYTEIYGFFRSTLGWNELTHSKMFTMGPLKNISWAYGADGNTDNTALGSAKRSVQAGVQADFAAPYNGNVSLSVFAYKEWQHDGFTAGTTLNPSGNVQFDTTWGLGVNYTQPLGFLPPSIPLTYKAIIGMHGPKGYGENPLIAPGARKTELFTQQTLDLDTGKILFSKPNMWSVWVGFRYWHNKFGLNDTLVVASPSVGLPFATESTWLLGSTWAW
jgi:nucleoside-specific outer membrane channel protein Tsx